MKGLCVLFAMTVWHVMASQWTNYAAFEADATNALAHVDILMSPNYTNRLELCRGELDCTNEIASAALLMLAISDDAKSVRVEEFLGNTNYLNRIAWFMNCPVTERTLWQKSCAIVLLSTGNTNVENAREFFNCATNCLRQWDSSVSNYSGGGLYQSIAGYFGAQELSPRQCLIFAAADSAKTAGLSQEFDYYSNMLPSTSREFLNGRFLP